ncbi:MAG: hypothetical protein ABIR70_10345 [Bryobacteraceae bacterium]
MEVHFKPEVQARLDEMVRESGRSSDELVEDAVIGYFDEVVNARDLLARRFAEMESGQVQPLDGEEALRLLMEKTEARRRLSQRA